MSHSLKVVSRAAFCWAETSWLAILRRSGESLVRVKRSFDSSAGAGGALDPADLDLSCPYGPGTIRPGRLGMQTVFSVEPSINPASSSRPAKCWVKAWF